MSKGKLLFAEDLFFFPSYFEFDDFNKVIITYCSHKKYTLPLLSPVCSEFRLWSLENYSLLYSICDKHVSDIRIGYFFILFFVLYFTGSSRICRSGLLLLARKTKYISNRSLTILPILAMDVSSGTTLYRANLFLHSPNKVEFLEVFEEYIFLKQKGHRLVIFSVCFLTSRLWNVDVEKPTHATWNSK